VGDKGRRKGVTREGAGRAQPEAHPSTRPQIGAYESKFKNKQGEGHGGRSLLNAVKITIMILEARTAVRSPPSQEHHQRAALRVPRKSTQRTRIEAVRGGAPSGILTPHPSPPPYCTPSHLGPLR